LPGHRHFAWTRAGPIRLLGGLMQQPETKRVTPASLVVDAILVIVFFVYMYSVVSTHVPSRDHRMILFWGLACASCLTAVFWLALQMFRVVARAQREASKG
jgi:hypothetical protein